MAPNLARFDQRATPEVSVLMAVRDGMPALMFTWNTLRRSVGCELEFVFVDDGSRDETPHFLKACAATDPRVRVLRTGPAGLVSALSAGLSVARGPYVARVDADDLVHPERFAIQLEQARSAGQDVVGSRVRCFSAVGPVASGLRRYEAWHNGLLTHEAMAADRFVESPLIHPSVLFRRETVLDAGGYREAGVPEDYDLWLRLFASGASFGKSDRVLTWWRDHPNRLTRTAAVCSPDAIADCKAMHLLNGPLSQVERVLVAGTGDDGKRLARRLSARGRPVDAFLDLNPHKVGQRIGGAPVLGERDGKALFGDGTVVLAAIGAAGRREQVRAYFEGLGLREGAGFICVA